MSTLALKATAGGSVQLKADDALTTDEVLKVFSNDIASRVLTGAELTAIGIIGTSPEATLWANGDITGSSSNGEFTKYANGDVEISYTAGHLFNAVTEYPAWTFPLEITTILFSSVNTRSNSGSYVYASSVYNFSASACSAILKEVSGNTAPSITYQVNWKVIGRWK